MVITGLTRNQCASNRTWVRIPSSPPKTQSYQGFCPYDWAFLFSQGHIGVHDFRQELRCASRSALCPAESGYCPLHLPKLFDGHDVRVFRKHHLIKLSELIFLHRLEPPLLVLNPHFCGDFCLLPLIRIVPAPESHHGVSLLWCALVAASSISFASALVRKLIRFTAAPLPTKF